jgi:hypothetical protein
MRTEGENDKNKVQESKKKKKEKRTKWNIFKIKNHEKLLNHHLFIPYFYYCCPPIGKKVWIGNFAICPKVVVAGET